MPRAIEGMPDKLGIRYFGDVLTGKLSVREALALAARSGTDFAGPHDTCVSGSVDRDELDGGEASRHRG
jgi:hypothetical protein